MGGLLSFVLRALAPIAVEHGGQVLRDRVRARIASGKTPPQLEVDRLQQVAEDVQILREALGEIKAEMDDVTAELAGRANLQRTWIIVMLAWNVVVTAGLIVAVVVLRRH